ncbi:MAG: metalloregulator ArsR/SmtB family transcription factor [Candidatus Nanopelagicales bacterium]
MATIINYMVEKAGRSDDRLTEVFAALADPLRREIVTRLTAGDETVTSLAEPYDMSLQAVSKHIAVLERAGLVTKRADAQRRQVHLEADVLDLATAWLERYRRQAEDRYRRLDALLESPERRADTEGIA